MTIDFTNRSVPFLKASLKMAFKQYYPDHPLKGLKFTHLINTVIKFAEELVLSKDTHYAISRKSIDLSYADLPHMAIVSQHVKMVGFMKDNIPTVYFYPRRKSLPKPDGEVVNVSKRAFKVQLSNTSKQEYTYRAVTLIKSKLKHKEQGQFAQHFSHVVDFYLSHPDSFLELFHALKSLNRREEKDDDAFHLFIQGVETDLSSYRPVLFSKVKKDISKEVIRWCFSMVEAVKNLHEKKIYHGWISLSAFHVKTPMEKRELGLLPSGFSQAVKRPKERKGCKGKPILLLGYESIQQMIQTQQCDEAEEGLPGDAWALGCALHHWVLGDYPAFALFASMAPQLNAGCMKLKEKILEKSDREMAAVVIHELVRPPSMNLAVSLKEIKADWEKSKEMDMQKDEPLVEKHFLTKEPVFRISNSFRDDLERLSTLVQNAHSALAAIELEELGVQLQTSIIGKVKRLHEIVTSISSAIFELLLRDDLVLNHQEIVEQYLNVCSRAIGFNKLLLKELEEAEQQMAAQQDNKDPLIRLIQNLLHPDQNKRITVKKAHAFLKKHYSQILV